VVDELERQVDACLLLSLAVRIAHRIDAKLAVGHYVSTLGRARVHLQPAAEVLLP
jgi:hypothetical protein